MQRNVDQQERKMTVFVSLFSSNCMLRKFDQPILNRNIDEKEGKRRISQDKSPLLEYLQDTAKHTVYTQSASGIQMQRHIQFILLLLGFFLQSKLFKRLDGEVVTQPEPLLCTETRENFCINLKQCLLEKGSSRSTLLGWISAPLHHLSQVPLSTAESAQPYRTDWAVR